MASTAVDMTPVAIHPTSRIAGPTVNFPMARFLVLINIIIAIIGTEIRKPTYSRWLKLGVT
jgi:hypothetical protein